MNEKDQKMTKTTIIWNDRKSVFDYEGKEENKANDASSRIVFPFSFLPQEYTALVYN